jgi:hypothetical protein
MTTELEKPPYNLTIVDGQGHISFVAKGNRTREVVTSLAKEILDTCVHRGINTALIDVRNLKGRLKIFDSLGIIKDEFPRLNWLGIFKKAAIVDRQENGSRLHFFESVARSRGYNLRTFVDQAQAVLWLRESDHRLNM